MPVETIDLGPELGYEGYWLSMPKSVKEGFLHEFSRAAKAAQAAGAAEDDTEAARATNIKLLEIITAWNLTDDAEKPLPLIRDVKGKSDKDTRERREAVLAEVPIDIIIFVANRLNGNISINTQTKDFSNGS